jgi:hypothetical protein
MVLKTQYLRELVVAGTSVAVPHLPLSPKEEPDTNLRGAHQPQHGDHHSIGQVLPVPPQEPLRTAVEVGGVGSNRLGDKDGFGGREGGGGEGWRGFLKKGEVFGCEVGSRVLLGGLDEAKQKIVGVGGVGGAGAAQVGAKGCRRRRVAADHEAATGVCLERVRGRGVEGEAEAEAAAVEFGAPAMEVFGAGEGG